jgi:hypothetical protein
MFFTILMYIIFIYSSSLFFWLLSHLYYDAINFYKWGLNLKVIIGLLVLYKLSGMIFFYGATNFSNLLVYILHDI